MPSNLDRYKKDLEKLRAKGGKLLQAMLLACFPNEIRQFYADDYGDKANKFSRTFRILTLNTRSGTPKRR
jgi:hypothetical protein